MVMPVRTLAVERLGQKIAHLSPETLDQLVEGLNEIVACVTCW